MVVAQVWRDRRGRQAALARLLRAVEVVDIDLGLGRAAGELCGVIGSSDPIDAALALIAQPGDTIITGDPDDLRRLAGGTGTAVLIVPA